MRCCLPLSWASRPAGSSDATRVGPTRFALATLRILVADAFAVPAEALAAATRGPADVAFARQTAMYLAHVGLGATFSEVGRAFGRDRTTAAHACRTVEERRDDPRVETLVAGLERALASVPASGSGEPAGRGA